MNISLRLCYEREQAAAQATRPTFAAAGRRTWNVVPLPTWLSTVTVPFILSTTCFTIESPRPVPPTWRERALSTR